MSECRLNRATNSKHGENACTCGRGSEGVETPNPRVLISLPARINNNYPREGVATNTFGDYVCYRGSVRVVGRVIGEEMRMMPLCHLQQWDGHTTQTRNTATFSRKLEKNTNRTVVWTGPDADSSLKYFGPLLELISKLWKSELFLHVQRLWHPDQSLQSLFPPNFRV